MSMHFEVNFLMSTNDYKLGVILILTLVKQASSSPRDQTDSTEIAVVNDISQHSEMF